MRLIDAFPTKQGADDYAATLKTMGVGTVKVKRVNEGRLKYGVFVAGKNSQMY